MASPQTVDPQALLAPIPGPHPAGTDQRYAGPYDAIREARRAEDALPQGDWKRPTKSADWPAVIKLATEALKTQAKDLQIAAWLAEALVKQHGFAGLRDGLRVLRELQERFWGSLYPAIEDGDLDARSGPLEWLNERLPTSLKAIPVTRSREGAVYSWLDWDESRRVDNLARQNPVAKEAALAEGKITGEQFDKAVAASPREFCDRVLEDLNHAWEEWNRLDRVVEGKFGSQAPSLLNLRKALEECRSLVEAVTKSKRQLEPDPAATQRAHPERAASIRPHLERERAGSMGSLEPQDRADAIQRLLVVAAFFRETEPQSPVSYLVERAVQWAEMPLDAWLKEVIPDEGVLARVRETLGLKAAGSGQKD